MKLSLSKRERSAVREYVAPLIRSLSPKLEAVILFGSKARGEARPESDIDIAVVIRENKSPSLRWAVAEPSFDPIAKYGLDLSPFLISSSDFRQSSSLMRRIKKEGIVLWNRTENTSLAFVDNPRKVVLISERGTEI